MKIWTLPLEVITTRYTGEWHEQFKEVFERDRINYEYLEGKKVKSNLEGKFFLDPVNTNLWKLSQLQKLIQRIDEVKNDDIVFFPDLWFPGIETLPYIKHLTGKQFKIAGILHAGTYDPYDLTAQTGMSSWGKPLEESWLSFVDKIFVATKFHKDLITSNRNVNPNKISVTGLPINLSNLRRYEASVKKPQIVFTGRKSKEKGYDIVERLKDIFPIVVALDLSLNKKEYYKLLGESKAVFAPSLQETFGYGVVEGMSMNCVPIVPDRLSFKDYVPKEFRYCNEREMVNMLERNLTSEVDKSLYTFVEKFDYVDTIRRMFNNV